MNRLRLIKNIVSYIYYIFDFFHGCEYLNLFSRLVCTFCLVGFFSFNIPRPGICVKYFLSSPQKTCHQRKLRQTKCLLFNFWMMKLTNTPILPNSFFFGISVNFIIQKLKSKHLFSLSQLSLGFFKRLRGNIFYTYSRP